MHTDGFKLYNNCKESKSSLLDHFYTILNDNTIVTKTLAFEISDHLPILTLLDKFKVKTSNDYKKN